VPCHPLVVEFDNAAATSVGAGGEVLATARCSLAAAASLMANAAKEKLVLSLLLTAPKA